MKCNNGLEGALKAFQRPNGGRSEAEGAPGMAPRERKVCDFCHKIGHDQSDCWAKMTQEWKQNHPGKPCADYRKLWEAKRGFGGGAKRRFGAGDRPPWRPAPKDAAAKSGRPVKKPRAYKAAETDGALDGVSDDEGQQLAPRASFVQPDDDQDDESLSDGETDIALTFSDCDGHAEVTEERIPEEAAMAVHVKSRLSRVYTVDSGATSSLCNDHSKYVTYSEFVKPIRLLGAFEGAENQAVGRGTLQLEVEHEGTRSVLEQPGSLFVRQLTSQLISVPKLDRQGLYTLCGDGQARIYTKSGRTLCIAPLVDNLYQPTVPEVPRA